MMRIDHLEFIEPDCDTSVHVGAFLYDDALTGESVRAEFFVRTCQQAPEGIEFYEDTAAHLRRDRRVDDYNEQFGHQWEALERQGVRNLKFEGIIPDPIFG